MRISRPQSHLRYPLTGLLGSGGNVRLLRALSRYGAPLSVAQLARDAAMSVVGVRASLAGLVAQGIVSVFGQGRAQLYDLNSAHPFSEPLKVLFAEELMRWEALWRELRDALKRCSGVTAAWLYGSVARGNDGASSDIDIVLVVEGDAGSTSDAVRDALRPLEERQQVSFSLVVLSPADILARAAADPWWSELERDARPLKGSAPERVVALLRRRPLAA